MKWLVEHADAGDAICADEMPRDGPMGQRTIDPWRRDGETVEITVVGKTITHVVEFGPTPDYKILKWHVKC